MMVGVPFEAKSTPSDSHIPSESSSQILKSQGA